MLQVTKGRKTRPVKLCLYGVEGIGKSTIASHAPDPIFVDTEGGSAMLDVARVEPKTWAELMEFLGDMKKCPGFQTVVLDTADWAERMAVQDICLTNKKTGIEDFGYGKGWTYVGEAFGKLLDALDEVVAAGKNVIVLAHAVMRKVELPDEQGSFDHWELKLSKQSAPKLKEWADDLLFANYKTDVTVDSNGKGKASGGKRVLYTAHRPYWDAKNRHGLKECLPMEYASVKGIFPADTLDAAPTTEEPTDDWADFVKGKGFEPSEADALVMVYVGKGSTRAEAIELIKNNWDKAAEWLTKKRGN